MTHLKRWLNLSLAAALALTMGAPAWAAEGTQAPASISVTAKRTDRVSRELRLDVYHRDEGGMFREKIALNPYQTPVTRATGDAVLTIRTEGEGVQVTVDCLTDLDSDGVYELLNGDSAPVSCALSADGLSNAGGSAPALAAGEYTLTAKELEAAGEEARAARASGGSQALELKTSGEAPSLYLVNLRAGERTDVYYFALYDDVLMPADVPAGSWYYSAVEYTLREGCLSGTGADSFTPDGTVTRAQLAQLLWNLGGKQEAEAPGFDDVPETAWYGQAAAWCGREGLLEGSGGSFLPDEPVSRELLMDALYRYAHLEDKGPEPSETGVLSRFPDGDAASPWAVEGLEWAVSAGILSGYGDGTLRPGDSLTRAQLARVLADFLQLE